MQDEQALSAGDPCLVGCASACNGGRHEMAGRKTSRQSCCAEVAEVGLQIDLRGRSEEEAQGMRREQGM